MSLTDKLKSIAQRIPQTLPMLETEEATKNALIMPFIAALGYDVFDPTEVIPEFTADIGTKKGEKVDYAIKRDDEIIILVEAKKAKEDLGTSHASQLYRYFSVTAARIAILTNGVKYQFYSDLEAPNKMDSKPFLEVDLRNLRDDMLQELDKLSKASFNLESMLTAANDLKSMREIRRYLDRQFEAPDEDFVKLCFQEANPSGRFVQSVKEQFSSLVRQTLHQLVAERVNARLRSALEREADPAANGSRPPEAGPGSEATDTDDGDGIETTEDELEGYRIVKAIACSVLSPDRITWRDAKSYFSVLVDDNNRKPLCRLRFNTAQKYIGLFDQQKNEAKHPLASPDDIYKYADELRSIAAAYAGSDAQSGAEAPAGSS